MEMYGAKVKAVTSGSRTLKDAVNEAMRSAEADAQSNMNKLTGSLNLGGLGGLF